MLVASFIPLRSASRCSAYVSFIISSDGCSANGFIADTADSPACFGRCVAASAPNIRFACFVDASFAARFRFKIIWRRFRCRIFAYDAAIAGSLSISAAVYAAAAALLW